MNRRPVVIMCGAEAPNLATGTEYSLPDCLNNLSQVADVSVTEDEKEETILGVIKGATILMIIICNTSSDGGGSSNTQSCHKNGNRHRFNRY